MALHHEFAAQIIQFVLLRIGFYKCRQNWKWDFLDSLFTSLQPMR